MGCNKTFLLRGDYNKHLNKKIPCLTFEKMCHILSIEVQKTRQLMERQMKRDISFLKEENENIHDKIDDYQQETKRKISLLKKENEKLHDKIDNYQREPELPEKNKIEKEIFLLKEGNKKLHDKIDNYQKQIELSGKNSTVINYNNNNNCTITNNNNNTYNINLVKSAIECEPHLSLLNCVEIIKKSIEKKS